MRLPIKRSHLTLVILSVFLLVLMLPLNLGTLGETEHQTTTGFQIIPPPYSTNSTLVNNIRALDEMANPQCTWTVSHELDTSVHLNYVCPNTYTIHSEAGPLLYLLSPLGLLTALQVQPWVLWFIYGSMFVIWLTVRPRRWVLDMLGRIPVAPTLAPGQGESADHFDAEKEAESKRGD